MAHLYFILGEQMKILVVVRDEFEGETKVIAAFTDDEPGLAMAKKCMDAVGGTFYNVWIDEFELNSWKP
jgi:hypothetical protein